MAIYLWKRSENYPEQLIGLYDEANSLDPYAFLTGKRLSCKQLMPPAFKFAAAETQLKRFDCLVSNGFVLLISDMLADQLLACAEDDIQLFPTKIYCNDGELFGYKLLNIINVVPGVEYKQTSEAADNTAEFDTFLYRSDCLKDYHLARDEQFKSRLLVSKKIYNHFKAGITGKISGVDLLTPGEYYHRTYGHKKDITMQGSIKEKAMNNETISTWL